MRSILITAVLAIGVSTNAMVAAQSGPPPAPSPAMHPSDAEMVEWLKFRREKFGELKAAAPNQQAEIADIKARAAAAAAAAGPLTSAVDAPPVIFPTGRAAPYVFLDDPEAPRMVIVPAGEFTMGSPASEPGRAASEGPQHRVRIGYAFAVSMFPIVWGEYALFIAETHRPASSPCVTIEGGKAAPRADRDWRATGYPQTVRHPAACISYNDAMAYAAWVSHKTGHTYRLLSEAEYEYAERAGATTAYWWGNDANAGCTFANGLDQAGKAVNPAATPTTCNDGFAFAAPEGTYKPNRFGLVDIAGNVSSWTADCWTDGYAGAPVDGSANRKGDCAYHVLRGGSWASANLRAASRGKDPAGYVGVHHGFRLARVL